MTSRRRCLGALGSVPFAACAAFDPERAPRSAAFLHDAQGDGRSPETVARDESFWREVQLAFAVDRSMVNMNNGGVSPSPTFVHQKLKEHLDFSNNAPPWHMWQILEPNREGVRQRLAAEFGCDPEELAITRNASESLMICQHGFDLQRGDEVLTTDQDYPRMLEAFAQRERRHGIVVRKIALPVPCEDDAAAVAAFASAITDRTRLILVCHMINLTGQILPVRAIVALGRRHGIPVIVDGAHALAHFPFRLQDLQCDYYGSSLHKWLFAPIGTGLLYVHRERIAGLWPMMAAKPSMDADIRKFEEIGTHPAANALAIGEALTFHQGLGAERKAARLVYLRDRWAKPLLQLDGVVLHTSLKPGFACGIATVQLRGVAASELQAHLWQRHRILTTAIVHPQFEGIRVSPSVYTTLEEIDRFADAVERVARQGLPA
jgi:isopenicillin-N epimerase